MKKTTIVILILSLLFSTKLSADKKPASELQINYEPSKSEKFVLENGLQIISITKSEQPTVELRLIIKNASSPRKANVGVPLLSAKALRAAYDDETEELFTAILKSFGARIDISAKKDFIEITAKSIKKREDELFKIISRLVANPSFKKDDFAKAKREALREINREKERVELRAQKLSYKALFGYKHPEAVNLKETNVVAIELDDVIDYIDEYFKPNNASLAIIGDIVPKGLKSKLERYFGDWEKSDETIKTKAPAPKPETPGAYFIEKERKGAFITQIAALAPEYTKRDYEKLELAAQILKENIEKKLSENFQQDAFSYFDVHCKLTRERNANILICGVIANNLPADTVLNIALGELDKLKKNPPTESQLTNARKRALSSRVSLLDNSLTTAAKLQDADFFGTKPIFINDYATRIQDYSEYSLTASLKKYADREKVQIIAVGDSEIKNKLSEFGKIYEHNLELEPLSGKNAKLEQVDMDVEELLENYVEALGGEEAIANVKTIIDTAKFEMKINDKIIKGTIYQYQKAPNKKYYKMKTPTYTQEVWINGDQVWMKYNSLEKIEGKDKDFYILDAAMFFPTKLLELGYEREILGKQKNVLALLKAVSPNGVKNLLYFDANSRLLTKVEKTKETKQKSFQITDYFLNYKEFKGVKLPTKTKTTSPYHSMEINHSYDINKPIEDKMFTPSK